MARIERVIFTEEAQEELIDAYRWYEERETGLGEGFLECCQEVIKELRAHPSMFPVAAEPFRRALVRRFPYEIFYEPLSEEIVVHSVFHCSQDPEKWRRRLLS